MNLRTLLAIHGWFDIVLGAAYVLIPAVPLGLFLSEPPTAQTLTLVRYEGIFAVGLGVIMLAARRWQETAAQRAVAMGMFVLTAPSLVMTLLESQTGMYRSAVWGGVASIIFLTLAWWYVLFAKTQR
jgi:hypothetical protein